MTNLATINKRNNFEVFFANDPDFLAQLSCAENAYLTGDPRTQVQVNLLIDYMKTRTLRFAAAELEKIIGDLSKPVSELLLFQKRMAALETTFRKDADFMRQVEEVERLLHRKNFREASDELDMLIIQMGSKQKLAPHQKLHIVCNISDKIANWKFPNPTIN